ncbi:MAG: transketolase [Anaerolineaceae bacterium]|nr:transketolase [Anaerolineaceae bacterium]
MTSEQVEQLTGVATQLRCDSLRLIHRRGAGHPGGALSAAEIMAVLYFDTLRIDPTKPDWEARDRFLLSKGHASAVLYSALARRGFFPLTELDNWGEVECRHQGHPDRLKTPGVDMTSGILGHGVAIGCGLALAARLKKQDYRTYVLIGDGESQGGIVWEGAMTAAKFKLDNLIVILDYNDVQLDGFVHDIMPLEPVADKWTAFGWQVIHCDGHDIRSIQQALAVAQSTKGKPILLIAKTIKGKGVSFMENNSYWHGNVPNDHQLSQALAELGQEVTDD